MEKDNRDKYAILFVCLGNICRSPSAEAVMKDVVKQNGLEDVIYIDSAGISGLHEGEKADARMITHAIRRGYDLTSISRPVTTSTDFSRFNIIIGMDAQNIKDLKRLAPDAESAKKIHIMTEFCSRYTADRVPDPYYGGAEGFELVLDLLEDACEGLLEYVKEEMRNK